MSQMKQLAKELLGKYVNCREMAIWGMDPAFYLNERNALKREVEMYKERINEAEREDNPTEFFIGLTE